MVTAQVDLKSLTVKTAIASDLAEPTSGTLMWTLTDTAGRNSMAESKPCKVPKGTTAVAGRC